jgi:hypothetical protein
MRLALTILLAASATTHAQTNGTFLLVSSNTVSPSTPTTTIEIWATWVDPSARFLFGGTNYDIEAGDGVFTGGTLALGSSPPNSIGAISGRKVTGAAIGQFLLVCDPFGCPNENPILLATYDWTTTDFTPRTVALESLNTNNFVVGTPVIPGPQILVQMYPSEFTPGSGVITVVPAPAGWLVLALPLVGMRRRR